MPKFKVVDGHKKVGGKLYAPGDTIDCSKSVAEKLRLVPVQDEPGNEKDKGKK